MTTTKVKLTNAALAALITNLLTNPASGEVDSVEGFESLVDSLTQVVCDHCGGEIAVSATHQGGAASDFGASYVVEVAPVGSAVWLPDPASFPPIVVGQEYEFHAEMQESELPAGERMRNYTGQKVVVISGPEKDDEGDPELSAYYKVRAADGREFTAAEEELNGWDKALGQFFWADGTYGPDRDTRYLSNEKRAA